MPPKYSVELSRRAVLDLQQIQDHIAQDSPSRAQAFVQAISAKILSLETLPLRSPLVPEKSLARQGYRHLLLGDYRVIHRLEDDRVWVVRVLHGARLLGAEKP